MPTEMTDREVRGRALLVIFTFPIWFVPFVVIFGSYCLWSLVWDAMKGMNDPDIRGGR